LKAQDVKEKESRILDFSANITNYNTSNGEELYFLKDSVWMSHKDITLTCDSAVLNRKTNEFKGYGRVHIIKSDTLNIFGDQLDYNGSTEMTRMDGRVRMETGESIIRTKHLDYNMKEEIAWYFDGGQIIDGSNTLESGWGYYYLKSEDYFFKESVFFSNEENTLSTDTLKYNSKLEKMWFLGPTQIFGDTNYIYCENGWYESKISLSSYNKNAIFQSGQQVLKGDSLVYDRKNQKTIAFRNVEAKDTIENSLLLGERLFYDEAADQILMTENAMYILVDEEDSLFLHADTLNSFVIDSSGARQILAYHRVQFYRSDIQGRCDSLKYPVSDSTIFLYQKPILWQEDNQLTAEEIFIKLSDQGIDYIDLLEKGFLVTRLDSSHHNQVKGKSIKGYFIDGKLNRVDVNGNGESLFYPEDDDGMIGLLKAKSSDIQIVFLDGKVDVIKFLQDPDPRLDPMSKITEADKKLEGFVWFGTLRPASRDDLYIWKE